MAKNKKSGKKSHGNKKQHPKQPPQEESTTTTSSSNNGQQYQVHEQLTNTNTDKFCLDTKKPFFFRYFYQYSLWTGLYMLNPYEQAGFNLFGWVFAICMIIWMFVFINGFRDGFKYEQAMMMAGGEAGASMMG